MQISIIQAILIGTLYYLTNNGVPWLTGLGSVSIRQPICAGTIVGLILGKPVEGCIMGATINTLYLGFVNAGGTLPTDPGIGGVVGTALALSANATPQVAMSIAVPLGVMGTMVWTLRQTVNIYFVHQMDKYAVTGDIKKMAFWQLVPTQLFGYAVTMIPCALLVYFGAPAKQGLLGMLAGQLSSYSECDRRDSSCHRYCHDHPYAEYKKRNPDFLYTRILPGNILRTEYAGGINFCGNRCLLLW